jgi:AcrR family transcriptional regulator
MARCSRDVQDLFATSPEGLDTSAAGDPAVAAARPAPGLDFAPMGRPKQRTPSNEVENAIVDAAFHLLEAEGPEALSVRRVAAEAGVAPMGVYNHFEGGKNGVVDACFRIGFEILGSELIDVVQGDDPTAALRAGLLRYRTLALEHPRCYEMMFLHAVPGFVPSEQSHVVAGESFEVLVRSIARGMRHGAFRDDDPREVAQLVWSAIHGAVALELGEICMVDDMAANYAALVETIIRGISVPDEKPAKARPATAKAGRAGSPARAARPARAR